MRGESSDDRDDHRNDDALLEGLANLLAKNTDGDLYRGGRGDDSDRAPSPRSGPAAPLAPTVEEAPSDDAAPIDPVSSDDERVLPHLGLVIDGKRELIRHIGAGSFGSVYEARQRDLDRLEAVKFLHERWMGAEYGEIRARFLAEARVMARMQGPHLVAVHDWGILPGGLPYFVMERLEGKTLRQRLHQDDKLPLPEVFEIAVGLLKGLCEVHAHRVIHRDVKPGNIILTDDGIKLLDFGLAKTSMGMTSDDVVMGTPLYMAPEVVTGEARPDARTDLYAAAVVIYEMLAGEAPFRRSGKHRRELERSIVHEAPAPLSVRRPGLPAELEALVLGALAKRQTDRPSTAQAMLDRLLHIQARWREAADVETRPIRGNVVEGSSPNGDGVFEDVTGPDGDAPELERPATGRRRWPAVALVVVALVLVGVGGAMWPLRSERGDLSDGILVVRSYWASQAVEDAHASACAALGGERALPADAVGGRPVRCVALSWWDAAWPRLQRLGDARGAGAVVLVSERAVRIRVSDQGPMSPLLAQLPSLELPTGTGAIERVAPVLEALLRPGAPVGELPVLDPVRDGFHATVLAEVLRRYHGARDPQTRERLEVLARCAGDTTDAVTSYYCDLAQLLRAMDMPCERAIVPLRTLVAAAEPNADVLALTARAELARCLARDGRETARDEAERLALAVLAGGPTPCIAASLMSTVAHIAANGGDRSGALRRGTTLDLVTLQRCPRPMVARELGERAYLLATAEPPRWCAAARDAADAHDLLAQDIDVLVNWAEAVAMCPKSTTSTRDAVVSELDLASVGAGAPRVRVAFMRWVLTRGAADARAVLDAYDDVSMNEAPLPPGPWPSLGLCESDRSSCAYEVLMAPKGPDSAVQLARGLGLD
ncbi:MAG: serine/threonine-protein kinase [Myxococcota bacterium]